MVSSQSNITSAAVLPKISLPPTKQSVLAAEEVPGVGLGQGDAGGLASFSESDPYSLSLLLLLLLLLLSSLLSKPSIASACSKSLDVMHSSRQ